LATLKTQATQLITGGSLKTLGEQAGVLFDLIKFKGEAGYMRMARTPGSTGPGICGVNEEPYYPTV
jgi:hypothetical protein